MRRVVITGIGALSPNGNGREAFWKATKNGESGVGTITHFNPEGFQVRIAGEVRGFSTEDWVDVKDRPHVSRVVPLARAAANEALEEFHQSRAGGAVTPN